MGYPHSRPAEGPGPFAGFRGLRALITAGGIGTRLLPFSKEIPKEMFPIITYDGNGSLQLKPLVQAIFEQLYDTGIRNFYMVVGRGKRAIEDHFSIDPGFLEFLSMKGKLPKSLPEFYAKIRSSNLVFLNQIEPLGFGDAVLLSRPLIDGTFIVQAGDTFILSEGNDYLARLAAMHQKYHASATVLMQDVPDPRQYGVVEGPILEEGVLRITSAIEKPATPRSSHAIMPVYIFTSEVFDALARIEPDANGELQLTDAIQRLIQARKPVIGVKLRKDELRLDLGSPETMIEALKLSLRNVDRKTNMHNHSPNSKPYTANFVGRGESRIGIVAKDQQMSPLISVQQKKRATRRNSR